MVAPIENIRNIGIIAHIDAGKTTTTERILYYTGASHRMGNVDEGTTVTDFDPEEAKRGITIYSAAITCYWNDTVINLIDTPGHVDFTAEVERSLRVLDGGVVIFSAVEGVEAQSETVWRQADRYHVPRLCFINKLDRIGADFERTFRQIAKRLHAQPVALQIPIGAGPANQPDAFEGIIDLIERKAIFFTAESQGVERRIVEIPQAHREQAESWRRKLLESLAMLDDDLLASYMEHDDAPNETIHAALRASTIHGQIQPVLCGSALNFVGVQPLLDAISRYLPDPREQRATVEGLHPKKGTPETRKTLPNEPFCGLVFKIQADQHGDLCFVRVYSGTLKSRSRVLNPRTGTKELVSQLWRVQAGAREKLETDSVQAGDIVGVIGPKDVVTGDTLCDQHKPIVLESIVFPETVISMAVEPETTAERKKLEETLKRLERQDPTFRARVSEETGQTIISGMGELHLEVLRDRLLRDFGLKVRVHKPRVSYRETVRRPSRGKGEFHRQVGDHYEQAVIELTIEPFTSENPFTVHIPHDVHPEAKSLIAAAIHDVAEGGGVVGFPLMNVRFNVQSAKHDQPPSELALRVAAAEAVRNALHEENIALLEPIMKLEVVTPEEFLGNIQGDLNSRRAVIVHSELRGGSSVLEAEAPLSRMFGYSTQVRSLSQGRASYSMEPLKYDEAPPEVLREMMGL